MICAKLFGAKVSWAFAIFKDRLGKGSVGNRHIIGDFLILDVEVFDSHFYGLFKNIHFAFGFGHHDFFFYFLLINFVGYFL